MANSASHLTSSVTSAAPAAPPAAPSGHFHLLSYLLGLVTALILLGTVLFLLRRPETAAIQLQPPPPVETPSPTATVAPPTPAPIVVFVSGAVQQPGLYTLPPTARIGDAILAAGGLLPGSDPALINQAQPLSDGAQLNFPLPNQQVDAPPLTEAQPSMPAADTQPSPPLAAVGGAQAPQPKLLLPTPTTATRAAAGDLNVAAGASAAGLINVNTATAAELEALPGIGPVKAQAIVDNRPYATVDEIDRVPGIGPATLERLRSLVTSG